MVEKYFIYTHILWNRLHPVTCIKSIYVVLVWVLRSELYISLFLAQIAFRPDIQSQLLFFEL